VNKYKERGLGYARSIQSRYKQHIEGKPLAEIDYNISNAMEDKLCMLNGIFGMDIDDEDVATDPICSITFDLKEKLTELNEKIRALSKQEEKS
jgi:predicted RNA-binding protein with PUA domain